MNREKPEVVVRGEGWIRALRVDSGIVDLVRDTARGEKGRKKTGRGMYLIYRSSSHWVADKVRSK